MNRHLQDHMKATAKSTLRANRSNEFMASKILEGMKENIRAIAEGRRKNREEVVTASYFVVEDTPLRSGWR